MKLPKVTLFMLMSVDGKSSTGIGDNRDFDKDIPQIYGANYGLHQYYELEKETDKFFIVSGKTMAKVGANVKTADKQVHANCIILDNNRLSYNGVQYLCDTYDKVIVFTTNKIHQGKNVDRENLYFETMSSITPIYLLNRLRDKYKCKAVTLQGGGTINAMFLRYHAIDAVDMIVSPILVGGAVTPTVVDGVSLTEFDSLGKLGILNLNSVEALDDSYVRLRYTVLNSLRNQEG